MSQVLIVDDEEDIRDALELVLSEAGHHVVPVSNGEDALRYLGGAHPLPNLILLDLRMPVMDGATFLASLRGLPPSPPRDIPVIVMTAGDDISGQSPGYRSLPGANGTIPKPFSMGALLEIVEVWSRGIAEGSPGAQERASGSR